VCPQSNSGTRRNFNYALLNIIVVTIAGFFLPGIGDMEHGPSSLISSNTAPANF